MEHKKRMVLRTDAGRLIDMAAGQSGIDRGYIWGKMFSSKIKTAYVIQKVLPGNLKTLSVFLAQRMPYLFTYLIARTRSLPDSF